jgi:8-oxo-dGTP pyrophosphatase MutT (NUDIX family)
MLPGLPAPIALELDELAARYGRPLLKVEESGYWNPRKAGGSRRLCEVCMVVRRPNGRLITGTKTFYPAGAFRLLTGGVERGERVLDALRRETHEETGLRTEVRRFLAAIAYRPIDPPRRTGPAGRGPQLPVFYTFAFLVDEIGGTLGAVDPDERLEAYREVTPDELLQLADRLDHLGEQRSREVDGRWRDWGRFRAIAHRAVWEALRRPPPSPQTAASDADIGPEGGSRFTMRGGEGQQP